MLSFFSAVYTNFGLRKRQLRPWWLRCEAQSIGRCTQP